MSTAAGSKPMPATPTAGAAPVPVLHLRNAGVRFGTVQALQGVDLSVHRGERLALVGVNGCGKTTLLRLLHGLVPCSSGVREVPAHAPPDHPATMAMLFQRPFLLSLSVRANVRLGLWLRGVPRQQRAARCEAALQRVGLADLSRRAARELSGGQQQRLALARAWALQPEVLFLDEPTASLDPSAKREVESLLAELAAEGTTLVMSTHNLGQAKRLATRVLHLEQGRVVADLPVQAFFSGAVPEATSQFLRAEREWV
ncbi:MAG: phosphate ABC transporter ATP-binding protein [Dolichospermum sp.]